MKSARERDDIDERFWTDLVTAAGKPSRTLLEWFIVFLIMCFLLVSIAFLVLGTLINLSDR